MDERKPVIECGPCTLRPIVRGDEAALARHANDRAVWRNLRDRFPHPYTAADAREWIEFNERGGAPHTFAIDVEGELVGGIGLEGRSDIERHTAELGIWLGRAVWGRGLATAAVRTLTAWGFENLDLVRIEAGVLEWNPACARVLEKCGYRLEARLAKAATKDGRTIDRFLYARLRED
jgi:[ribosomal protein S5]-alanine N-acetyltransferase